MQIEIPKSLGRVIMVLQKAPPPPMETEAGKIAMISAALGMSVANGEVTVDDVGLFVDVMEAGFPIQELINIVWNVEVLDE
jgi:hypothetical protein